MTTDRSDFDALSEDLIGLVQGSVPEGLSIDYKRDAYGNDDKAKREFLKDVSSFSNTVGGHILIGVAETAGLATAIPGLPGLDVDRELQRLEQIAQSGLEPRAQLMRRIPLNNGESVIAIRILQSWTASHRIIAQGGSRFFKRNSAGCYEPSVDELRTMFNAQNDILTRVSTYRDQRLAVIQGGGLWRPLLADEQAVLHVLPPPPLLVGNWSI